VADHNIKIQEATTKVTEEPLMKAQVIFQAHCQGHMEEDPEVEANMTHHMDPYLGAKEMENKNMEEEEEMDPTEEIMKIEDVAEVEDGDTFKTNLTLKGKLVHKDNTIHKDIMFLKNVFREPQAKEELIHYNVKDKCNQKIQNLYMKLIPEGQVHYPELLSREVYQIL